MPKPHTWPEFWLLVLTLPPGGFLLCGALGYALETWIEQAQGF